MNLIGLQGAMRGCIFLIALYFLTLPFLMFHILLIVSRSHSQIFSPISPWLFLLPNFLQFLRISEWEDDLYSFYSLCPFFCCFVWNTEQAIKIWCYRKCICTWVWHEYGMFMLYMLGKVYSEPCTGGGWPFFCKFLFSWSLVKLLHSVLIPLKTEAENNL